MWHTFKLVFVLSPSYGVCFCLFHPRRTCLLFLVKQFLSLRLLISPPVHRWLEGSMREGVCEQFINFKEFFDCKGHNLSASLLLTATPRPERDFDMGDLTWGILGLRFCSSLLSLHIRSQSVEQLWTPISVSLTQPNGCCLLDSIFLHCDLGNALTKLVCEMGRFYLMCFPSLEAHSLTLVMVQCLRTVVLYIFL